MSKDHRLYLQDMLRYIGDLESFTAFVRMPRRLRRGMNDRSRKAPQGDSPDAVSRQTLVPEGQNPVMPRCLRRGIGILKGLPFTADGYDAYLKDRKTQLAVVRAFEVLGEIAKRFPIDFREAHPEIEWRRLTGFRDFLAHRYDEVIPEFVWQAVEDLSRLKRAVNDLLKSLPDAGNHESMV